MLLPKKVKFRKWQTGRSNQGKVHLETRGTTLAFGSFGLKSEGHDRIRSNEIESARKAIMHCLKKTGKLWIRVFPDRPFTSKPAEVKMGKGKGDPQGYCVEVNPGRILFEVDGTTEAIAREALRKAGTKLGVKTRVISRT